MNEAARLSPAALANADDLIFDAIAEAAELAEFFSHHAVEAAEAGDRAMLRLRLCMASRALRSALEGCASLSKNPGHD